MAKTHGVVISEELKDLVPRFLEIREEELGLLRDALASGDEKQVAFLGHRIKGSAGSYGFEEVSAFGAALEEAGNAGDLETAGRVFGEYAGYMGNLEITYGDIE